MSDITKAQITRSETRTCPATALEGGGAHIKVTEFMTAIGLQAGERA